MKMSLANESIDIRNNQTVPVYKINKTKGNHKFKMLFIFRLLLL